MRKDATAILSNLYNDIATLKFEKIKCNVTKFITAEGLNKVPPKLVMCEFLTAPYCINGYPLHTGKLCNQVCTKFWVPVSNIVKSKENI